MHIANYRFWLKGHYSGKGQNFASLKLKVVRCGDLELLVDAMKIHPGVNNLSTKDFLSPPSTILFCDQVPIANNCDPPHPLVAFLCATKSICPPHFHVREDVVSQSCNTNNGLQKINGRALDSWTVVMWLESLSFPIQFKVWSVNQCCL